MAKKRALSIKAIVTQNSLDSDGNTVVTNVGTYYFPIELFVYDYIENFRDICCGIAYNTTSQGFKYLSFSTDPLELFNRINTIFNSPDTLEDKTLSCSSKDFVNSSPIKCIKELCTSNFTKTTDDFKIGTALSKYDSGSNFVHFVLYEFLVLSDEAYNKFIEVWKDRITKTLNSIFPELVGKITLVFTNSATTGE